MTLLKLRLTMLGTIALIIGASTLFFTIIMLWIGIFSLTSILFFVVIWNFIQWLIAPYMIDLFYHVRNLSESEAPKLHEMVRRICARTKQAVPKLKLAQMSIPNAFAYGSPMAGRRVAITTGLINTLEDEEVEAVIGHELGHLKHRDVQIMMFASVLPAVFYYIGYTFMLQSWFGGSRRNKDTGSLVIVGIASMAIYWVLTLMVMGLSRLREYYADQFATRNIDDGGRKLSEALAKIVAASTMHRYKGTPTMSSFKALMINDPDHSTSDTISMSQKHWGRTDADLVKEVIRQKVTTGAKVMEILSTHPNIVKRLRALGYYT